MLSVAKILKSDGTDGGVLVGFRDISAEEIDCKEPVFVFFDGLPVPFFICNLREKGSGGRSVVHFCDVENLKDAEELVGREIYVEEKLDEGDAAAVQDFAGWTLLDKGRRVGEITGVEPIPGNVCLCVGDSLVPLHSDLILSCEKGRRELNMDIPEGLLPDTESH